MAKKEPSSKTLLYTYDPDEKYTYNTKHGTEYPYNGFPTGLHGRKYKKTRENYGLTDQAAIELKLSE